MLIAYTRFDQVGGSNMLDDEERRDHVLAIQDGAIEAFQDAYNLNPKMVRQLREHMSKNSFFFPHANELKNPSLDLQEEMRNFIEACIRVAEPITPHSGVSIPEYDYGRLVLAINETEKLFMDKWLGLLGFDSSSRFPKQHWTRIKALANRLAHWPRATGYKELEPASDIASYLIQRLDTFLRSPKRWDGHLSPTKAEQQLVINKIAGIVSENVNELVVDRLKVKRLQQWVEAYGHKGSGSTNQRATTVRSIFEQTIPRPRITYDELTGDFLSHLQEIIDNALVTVQEESNQGIATA